MIALIRFHAVLAVATVVTVGASYDASATRFPIANADDAISVAKRVCLKYGGPLLDEDDNKTSIRMAMPTLKWEANLQDGIWYVSTEPSVLAGTNEHLLTVDVPVSGPAPTECIESGYDFFDASPPPKPPRGPCKPSDISANDAVDLVFEALQARGNGWGQGLSALSTKGAWVVTAENRAKDQWAFKVYKRTAIVLDVKTGELFSALPSKAHYVEHHCLDGR